ncbi:MAG: hypothetical protein JXL97_13510 [Bacteroidales bacterium]|nr:hypothetical protein [Bacteroidales bacterium]
MTERLMTERLKNETMGLFKNIFSKREPVLPFDKQIQEEIFQCETSIFEYERDVHQIRGWAIDLIHKTFEVPKELWYEELDNLEKIIQMPENKNIAEDVIEEVKRIAFSYKQQIELRKMKVEACRKNIIQLRQMIVDEQKIKKELYNENHKEFYIEAHKQKANMLQDSDITIEMVQAEKVKNLKNQIEELREELMLKQEVNKQLKILYQKYGDSTDYETTTVYLEELKKLI